MKITNGKVFGLASMVLVSSSVAMAAQPFLRNKASYTRTTANDCSGTNQQNCPTKLSIPVTKGDALWVVITIPDDSNYSNEGADSYLRNKVTDSQGNVFTPLDAVADLNQGRQTLMHFYAKNVKATGTDVVTVTWQVDNYKGVLIADVGNVTATPLIGHSSGYQYKNASGAGSVTTTDSAYGELNSTQKNLLKSEGFVEDTGSTAVTSSEDPALLLSLSMDTYGGASDLGGDGYAGPQYGSGFTGVEYLWNLSGASGCKDGNTCNLAAFETKNITTAQSAEAKFNATAGKLGTYVTLSVVFR